MKNDNKRGETARNEQNQTRSTQTGRTPVKQDLPGRNEKESYDREAPEEGEGSARKGGKTSDTENTRQPVKQDKRASGGQRQDEDRDQRLKETDPATAPSKTRETPKGNSPKM